MFIRKTVKHHNGRTDSTYLLVEAVRTPQGTPDPQQRLIYGVFAIPEEVTDPVKTWRPGEG